jgi:light-harvesting complex II chlorophyll a/b binding protein 5
MQRATAPAMQAADAVDVEVPAPPPAITTMRVGDKTLAGDWGFDPLGLADEPKKLAWYREAEVKHARLAMLAAAGWPLSEKLNAGGLLDQGGRVPSLLNGGLAQWEIAPTLAVAVFAASVLEKKSVDERAAKGLKFNEYSKSELPGDLSFDPLGLAPEDPAEFREMQEKELAHARLGMIAAAGFLAQEAVTKATWGTAIGAPDF